MNNSSNQFDLKKGLVEKSIEAFIMGIEIYNKPTIKYRIEGFSFFICNAWELMLKAEMLNQKKSIYYKDKPDRTLSLSDVLKIIYPDKHTKIRINLEKIIDLRNISTHYITEDYEVKYAPLFQACVLNFIKQMLRFHQVDITKYISQNFLTISASYEPLSNEQIKIKYPPEIAEKFIQKANEIDVLSQEYNSDKFSIDIRQNLCITKKSSDADFSIAIDKNSKNHAAIIKELKDPSDTHKYSYQNVITAVNERLKKANISLHYAKGFNSYVLNLIIDFYQVKNDTKYAYEHVIGNQHSYTYSQQFIEFIVKEIKKNPQNYVDSLKKGNKKR
jgi:HEPN domain-containing protein